MTIARIIGLLLLLGSTVSQAAAQSASADDATSSFGWYFAIAVVLIGIGGAYIFWRRSRKAFDLPKDDNRYKNYYQNETFDLDQVDATEELEWLRKAKKKTAAIKYGPKRAEAKKTKTAKPADLDTKVFQEKMKMLQYAQLPINSFNELSPAKKYEELPFSNDKALLTAIEQANEEYEEDEAIRELAVRILAAFRTSNSVEALEQMALYDLSSNLRSKSVSILTDFDHESVFEPILLACADPTREVRAAAARGLFRLNFDRADAWKRLIETGDEFRMSHAVRAAIEAGIVQKSFERLVHDDLKIAYEAFALVALMLKANETKEIFEAIRDHRDERVKFALVHVIKAVKDARSVPALAELLVAGKFSADVVSRIEDAVRSFDQVPA